MSRILTRRLLAALVLTVFLAACIDRGPPSTEDQMRSLGLPLDNLVTIDERTEVSIRSNDGTPELLVFVADVFGGSRLGVNPASRPTVNGGMVGDATSPGQSIDNQRGPAHQYLFGAGQGPIARVETDEPEARVELVNPDIDGWLIVVPETVGADYVPWRLVGTDGAVVYASAGIGMPDFGVEVDARTKVFERSRDRVPELLIYSPNAYGGADLAVTAADTPTVNGGLAGTVTSPGHRYLFGAGQGPLDSERGIIAQPSDRAELLNAVDWGWVIIVPDSVPIGDVRWQLIDPDGTPIYAATGLTPER
jgi:hypothetical protein